jgi:hypothetical protein
MLLIMLDMSILSESSSGTMHSPMSGSGTTQYILFARL